MDIRPIDARVSVTAQLRTDELAELKARGFRAVICNRPDGEAPDQPTAAQIGIAAEALGLGFAHVPVHPGLEAAADVAAMARALAALPQPILAYCRSGARSTTLIGMADRLAPMGGRIYDFVIIGGGAAGIATAASIRKRNRDVTIALIEPSEFHYYQHGWTMVGAGVFDAPFTRKSEAGLIPRGVEWIKAAVTAFEPDADRVILGDGAAVAYRVLIACPGITLDWQAIPGLAETLGQNGVTSNYGFDLAPYTSRLVKEFRGGRALFTQPPMPIKCAGAPQRRCICLATAGRRRDCSARSMSGSTLPARCCSACPPTSLP